MRVSLQNDSFGTSAYRLNSPFHLFLLPYSFLSVTNLHLVAVHLSSSFPASLEAGLSQAGDTLIPLPRKSLGHRQIVDCKVGLCTSLQTVAEFL